MPWLLFIIFVNYPDWMLIMIFLEFILRLFFSFFYLGFCYLLYQDLLKNSFKSLEMYYLLLEYFILIGASFLIIFGLLVMCTFFLIRYYQTSFKAFALESWTFFNYERDAAKNYIFVVITQTHLLFKIHLLNSI